MAATYTFDELLAAQEDGKVFNAKVIKALSFGLLVSFGGVLAALPTRQKWGLPRVGEEVEVTISSIDKPKGRIFVTRESLTGALFDRIAKNIEVGRIYNGTVEHLADYGIFVSVSNITGLVQAGEISHNKTPKFKDQFKVGQSVKVYVVEVDREKKRLILSIKRTLPHPFELIQAEVANSKTNTFLGRITSTVEYGLFVEFGRSNFVGLLHASAFEGLEHLATHNSRGQYVLNPNTKKFFCPGTIIPIKVLEVDSSKKRISLGYGGKPLDPGRLDAWPQIGMRISGRLERMKDDRVEINFGKFGRGYMPEVDDRIGYLALVFKYNVGDSAEFEVVVFDFQLGLMRVKLVESEYFNNASEYNSILENFITGQSHLDFNARLKIQDPYLVLAHQLSHLSGARLNKVFDYIYHFGHVANVDQIRLFGLLHRASVEFRLRKPEFALSLLLSAIKEAISLRHGRLTALGIAIARKNWGDIDLGQAETGQF